MLKVVIDANDASMKKRRMDELFEDEEIVALEMDSFESQQIGRVVANTKGNGKISTAGTQSTINQLLKKPIKEEADDHVVDFFYTSAIQFNCLKTQPLQNCVRILKIWNWFICENNIGFKYKLSYLV